MLQNLLVRRFDTQSAYSVAKIIKIVIDIGQEFWQALHTEWGHCTYNVNTLQKI